MYKRQDPVSAMVRPFFENDVKCDIKSMATSIDQLVAIRDVSRNHRVSNGVLRHRQVAARRKTVTFSVTLSSLDITRLYFAMC